MHSWLQNHIAGYALIFSGKVDWTRLLYILSGIVITLISFSTRLQAQQPDKYTFRHIDHSDGLLHNNVMGIRQDAKGFIWILTPNGLQRYDGTRFRNYYGIVNNAAAGAIDGADVYPDDKKNEVWVMKQNTLQKLDLFNNQFSTIGPKQVLKDESLKFDRYTDENNNRWLLGEKGLFFFLKDSDKPNSSMLNVRPLSLHGSNGLSADIANNQTWFASGEKIFLFEGNSKRVFSEKYNPAHNPLLAGFDSLGTSPRFIMVDSRSDCWIATWKNLFYRFNRQTGKIISYDLSAIKKINKSNTNIESTLLVTAFYEDRNGSIWIATENAGLLLYNQATDDFENVIVAKKDIQSSQYNYKINCIMQDREENIWIGTDKGISIFNPYRQYFTTIRHQENIASIPKNEILSFIQTRTGDILVSTWGGGIAVYDKQRNFKKHIFFPLPKPYEYNMVWSFAEQEDGTIWAGCQHGYVFMYNPVTEAIKIMHPPEFETSTIRCITADSKGNLWFGLHSGKIAEWDKEQDRFYAYSNNAQRQPEFNTAVIKIFIDRKQQFWVSTIKGFKAFDPVKRKYSQVFLPDKNNAHAISAISIQGIESYNDTTLVIGTIYGGLIFFNTVAKTFSALNTGDGLPSKTICALKKDTAGNIWFTTDYNLYAFKPGSKNFTRYNMEPGVINSSFITPYFYSLKDGTWLTASTTEVICFKPEVNMEDTKNAKVEIAGLKIFDKPVFIDSFLYKQKPVTLSYKQNFLTIDFALLNFSSLQQSKYYYRLSGVDKDWTSAGTKNFASYTNLDPGEYVFSVKTDYDNGSSTPVSFTILISPPFWKTWWFFSLIAIGIISLAYFFVRWRIGSIKAVEAEKLKVQKLNAEQYKSKMEMLVIKEKLSAAKLEALRSQMNPHFIFNCLNSIDNLIQNNEKEKATLYLAKFAKLIRSILETSKNNAVPCWKDIETLKVYIELEELRLDKKFAYELNVSEEILNGDYKVPPLIIQPFVENAIHHGLLNKIDTDRQLIIDIWAEGNYIYYAIEDNGAGREKAAAYKQLNKPMHESMGMQITMDRISLFNKDNNGSVVITDLYDDNKQPAGTKVEVALINQ